MSTLPDVVAERHVSMCNRSKLDEKLGMMDTTGDALPRRSRQLNRSLVANW